MGEPTGTKVLHIYDPAIIDYREWHRWKQGHGIYVLTREKENSWLTVIGDRSLQWDPKDLRNAGVLSDEGNIWCVPILTHPDQYRGSPL